PTSPQALPVLEAGVTSALKIEMRDYQNRSVRAEWGAVQWVVRFTPLASYPSPADQQTIASFAAPIHSIPGDPFANVAEFMAAPTDTSLQWVAPSTAGEYLMLLCGILNTQVSDAPRRVELYDHSPINILIGSKAAFGPQ